MKNNPKNDDLKGYELNSPLKIQSRVSQKISKK